MQPHNLIERSRVAVPEPLHERLIGLYRDVVTRGGDLHLPMSG